MRVESKLSKINKVDIKNMEFKNCYWNQVKGNIKGQQLKPTDTPIPELRSPVQLQLP